MLLREDPDDPILASQFAQWLAADHSHAQAWAEVCQTIDTLLTAPVERQHYELPGPHKPRLAWHKRLSVRLWAGSAAAMACAILTLFGPDTLLWLRADYYTGYGQTQHIHLADGSTIALAPRSAIAVHMTANARAITLLRGEALFDVQHNAQRPLTVTTTNSVATDLGTVFDVLTGQGRTTLAVKEGSSRFERRTHPSQGHDLHAGEWMSLMATQSMAGQIPPDSIGAWADGVLVARSLRLADLAARLQPWTRRRIVILDRTLAEKRVTGVYDLNNPLKALQLALRPHGGTVGTLVPGVLLVMGPS